MNTKRDLIKTIHCDRSNLEHIAKHQRINGTLLIEIERIMQEYANQQLKVCEVNKRVLELEKELLVTEQILADRQRVLDAIPECDAHGGNCVPNALEWIERMKSS